jgi:hypothetical protein
MVRNRHGAVNFADHDDLETCIAGTLSMAR